MTILAGIFLYLIVFLGVGTESSAGSAPAKIVLAYASMVGRTSFIWIAKDYGFFAKYGIDPELILISRGPVLIAGLTSGEVQIGNTGGTAALNAAVGGVELKLVATFNSRWVNNVVARSSIKSTKDLAKKRFGVSSFGGTQWMGTMLWLEHLGLDAQKDDIRFLVIGDQTLLAQALENGIIDAANLDSGFSRKLRQKGILSSYGCEQSQSSDCQPGNCRDRRIFAQATSRGGGSSPGIDRRVSVYGRAVQ